MNFQSSSYDWMVVTGNRVQYKGTGKINGIASWLLLIRLFQQVPWNSAVREI